MHGRRVTLCALILLAAATLHAQTVPAGFSDGLVADVGSPTGLAFTPDGRLLITTQGGSLRVYQGGSLLPTPAMTIPANQICNNSERGLLSVAVDPAFTTPGNNFIYVYYTAETPVGSGTCKNRVSRFTLPPGNVISLASELILIDQIHSTAGNHNGGDVQFGKDGLLYVSVGDGGCDYAGTGGCAGSNRAARDRHVMLGKILRITKDGQIPAGNPFQGAGTGDCRVTGSTTAGNWCRETFAWGLRNPFRMGFDQDDPGTRFFINDVGQGAREEIDLGQSGVDYGWNCREGLIANPSAGAGCPGTAMVDPIHDYNRMVGGSITGGAFVPNGVWPAAYDNDYMFADYVSGHIFNLRPNGAGGYTRTVFASGLGGSSATHLLFGPFGATQALYYATYANGGDIRRIAFIQAPVAVMSANPTDGAAPLTVNFDGTGSSDPQGGALTYIWNFGDGSPEQQTAGPTTSHVYGVGTFTASLRVRNPQLLLSNGVNATINSGNTPPVPSITTPANGATFRVGENVTLVGGATDAQDGTLPASALSWQVLLHHDTHTHPFLPPTTGNNIPFTTPAPEDLAAAANSFLEVILTATDSNNGVTTVARNFMPHTVNITLATNPAGLRVTANGSTFTGPSTFVSWEAYVLNVGAAAQVDGSGNGWVFASWSDGGAASHNITTPAAPATYTATFTASPVVTISDVTVPEGSSGSTPATFTVTLSNTPSSTVTIDYATANGTATSPGDYTGPSGTLTFNAAGSQTVTATVNGDTAMEPNETFFVNLSSTTVVLADTQGVGTIRADDWPGADFNLDTRTDILWRHDTAGQNVVWHMNGTALQSGTFTNPAALTDVRWKMVGTHHFNGDGRTDILWRHSTAGENVVWFMNGVNMVSGTFTTPAALTDLSWKASATADLNADGSADILWRHDISGQNVTWLMNGTVLASGTFLTTLPDTNWKIVGSGDFTLDGRPDIVFWHQVSGQVALWYMNGLTLTGGSLTNPDRISDTNWRPVGVGDFNVDARSDLLWHHQGSGQLVVWLMDGATLTSGTFTNPASLPDVRWKVVGPR